MDYAYDHITEEVVSGRSDDDDRSSTPTGSSEKKGHNRDTSLSKEFDQAYRTISTSPWGIKFGNLFEQVKKQGEVYYDAGKKEYSSRSEQAQKNWSELNRQIMTKTRELSENSAGESKEGEAVDGEKKSETSEEGEGEEASKKEQGPTSPAAVQAANLFARLRSEAMKGLTEVQKAEDAADAYLAKMGTNLGNFLKEAVTISPPAEGETSTSSRGNEKELLFENKPGEDSKRPIHSTRLDAQLHLLHANLDNFKSDPRSPKYASEWTKSFSADQMTDRIAKDLEQYPELRASMEKLVPDAVQYSEFWKRYYFLRGELDAEEQKRKELLKKAAQEEEEEVGWDEDDEEDDDEEDDEEEDDEEDEEDEDEEDEESEDEKAKPTKTPASKASASKPTQKNSNDTLRASTAKGKSADVMSQPDSEASYDVVSGAPSKTPSHAGGSPPKAKPAPQDESDEEDWE